MPEKALPRVPAPGAAALPEGFGVVVDGRARVLDGGATIVGGVPERLVRLSPRARRLLDGLQSDDPVAVSPEVAVTLVRPLLDAGVLHPRPGRPRSTPEDVTVVIPVRDRATALPVVLEGLGPVGRVVVVDDASTDGSGSVAREAGATVVRRAVRGGPAAARNTGLESVETPLVAFVDSDCRLPAGWLEGLLGHFDDPSVAVVAPRVVGDVAERRDPLASYESERSPQDLGRLPGYVRPGARVSFLPAAVMVARTGVVAGFGGFDEDLEVGEDVDFVWRLARSGWRVRYEPGVVAFHDARPDLARFLRRRVDYGTSAAALHRRHPGDVAPIGVSPWSVAVWGSVLAGRLVAAAGLAAATIGRLAWRLRGRVGSPARVAWIVAGRGHGGAARILASAIARTWLPAALVAMVASRRARGPLAAFLLVAPVVEWLERRPPLDPATYTALHLLDDAAYCCGVWIGCARHRTAGPLVPRLHRPEPLLGGGD
jgi:mycofactocin system glycosyltransferase